jgi:hypothetical protein
MGVAFFLTQTENSNMTIIPALTLIGPWKGDDSWTVTTNNYDSENPYDVCSQLRFDTKAAAEAFIAENIPSGVDRPVPIQIDDEPADLGENDDCPF